MRVEKRTLGRTGMSVTALGYGGAEIGFQHVAQPVVDRLLNEALDAGLNVIDTAECYNDSEGLIGRAVGRRRADYYLFTKVGHAHNLEGENWSPSMMRESIERSLRRLRTDCVDLLQLHSCSEDLLRAGEVVDVVLQARESGKTRFVGYSGDGDAAIYAIRSGAFDVLQTSVSVADQEAIDRVLPVAVEAGIGVIAKRPVANAAWRTSELPEEVYHQTYWRRLQKLGYEFLGLPLGEAVSVALRFTLAQPGVHTAIVGTSQPGRWSENAARLEADGPLSAETIEAIRGRWKEVAEADWVGDT